MSGIGSVSAYSTNPYAWLQQTTSPLSVQSDGAIAPPDASGNNPLLSLLEASGVDDDQLTSLEEQIKAAIASALQEAEQSGDSTDFRAIIKNAVDETLEANGIDPDTLTGQMRGTAPPPPPGMGGMPPGGFDVASQDDSSNTDASDATSDSGDTSDQVDALITLLQELLAQLQGGQTESNSLSGFLFDEQS